MTGTPTVSVIVLNYNGAHLLPECLDSLVAQEYPIRELLVIDNASVDGSRDVVRRYPRVQWVGLPVNGGLGPGYNAGARAAHGDALFFLNNDTSCAPDCLRQLVPALQADVLAADPLQFEWTGERVIHGAQRFRWGWRYLMAPVPCLAPYQEMTVTTPTDVPWACAGALLCDREKFEALGGFDPTFFLDYEDLDLCWRGWLRGWRTIFVPSARLRHRVGESADQILRARNPSVRLHRPAGINARRQMSQYQNAQRFVCKTMPWPLVGVALLGGLLKAVGGLLCGRAQASWLWGVATARNLRAWPEILRRRRAILQGAATTSILLARRWGASA